MHRALAGILVISALLSACGGGGEAAPAPNVNPARPVAVQDAKGVVLPLRRTAPADVLSPNESELSADVSARVVRIYADVGSTVKEGARLLQLDDTDYRLALAQAAARESSAEARVALARQRLERARKLVDRKFVSEDEVLALETELQAAQAEAEVAEADRRVAARNVEKTLIAAPFDGTVLERFAQVGSLAAAGSPLMRLVDLAPAEIEASLQMGDAATLDQAQELTFESQTRTYPVRLLRVASALDRAGRTRVARFAFVGESAPAGTSGRLSWQSPGQLLPAELLVKRNEKLGYFQAEGQRAVFVPVPGAQEGRSFEVSIEPDTQLIVAGHHALSHGDLIADRNTASASGSAERSDG